MDDRRILETLTWFVSTATAAAAILIGTMAGFSVHGSGLVTPLIAAGSLTAMGWFYRHLRPDVRIATAVIGVAQVVAFSAAGAVLSYLLAATDRPLWDATFMWWDQVLGLDWRAYLAFVNERPVLGWWLGIAYISITPQIILAVAVLALSGRIAACRTFLATFVLCAVVVILISSRMPAISIIPYLGLGAHEYPNLQPAAAYNHVADVVGLRDGTLRTLAIDRLEGIIAFPSLHAGLAVILARAFWSVPWMRWPGILLNAAMLAATPIHGSHYFVDIFAGVAVAGASMAVVRLVACGGTRRGVHQRVATASVATS